MRNGQIKAIPIMSAKLAKHLLGFGYRIIDIKPNPKEKKRTVFLFESKEEIMQKVREYTKNGYENK